VNYLYGTFLVLRGLEAMGVWNHEPAIQQAAEWIRMVQNADGGWGETCGTYDDPLQKGIGPSTPSQTAWAVLGLLAAGDTRSDSVAKGVRWLVSKQSMKLVRGMSRRLDATVKRLHRYWFPKGVLPGIPPVPRVLSRCLR
jgi:squalene cyclase